MDLELELWDGWYGSGAAQKTSFVEWLRDMADNPRGTLQDAAKAFLAEMEAMTPLERQGVLRRVCGDAVRE